MFSVIRSPLRYNIRHVHATGKTLHREKRYSTPRSAPLEYELDARLLAEASESSRSVAAVMRDAIARGLPLVRKLRLQRQRRAGGAS